MRVSRWALLSLLVPTVSAAQHEMHEPPPGPAQNNTPATEDMPATTMMHEQHEAMPQGVLGLPMSREGSGTSWLPDASPVRAFMLRSGDWHVMLHGNLFAGYDYQAGDAGDDKLVSQNWFMVMAGRPLAGGHFMARAMLSLEPLTVGKRGYPLLLQSGESVNGQPLVDRQHPHDLFMELAASYEHELSGRLAFQLYAGLAGEPALGPTAYPHRPSAMSDPLAPLGHHWEDSTHIAYGVVTAGLFTRTVKLEASAFNGREPDEERYNLDLRGFDSVSARLTVNPETRTSLQVSAGYLDSPEALEADVSVVRTTASVMHVLPIDSERRLLATAAWGRNTPSKGPATDGVLAEAALDLAQLGTTFLRAEYVVKTGKELALDPAMDDQAFRSGVFSLGHTHPILHAGGVETSLGLRGNVAVIDSDLEAKYGTRFPLGVMAYVQLQPEAMKH